MYYREVVIKEIWKVIDKFENYSVSQYGEIRNQKGNLISPTDIRGYKKVRLYNKGKLKRFYVHTLVATYFVSGKTRNRNEIDHKNNQRDCNYYLNLIWATRKQNMKDMHQRNPHIVDCLHEGRNKSLQLKSISV